MPWRKDPARLKPLCTLSTRIGGLGLQSVEILRLLEGGHEGWGIGEDPGLSLINVSDGIVLTLRTSRVVVDQSRVDGAVLCI